MKDMTEMVPEALDSLSGEERHRIYRMLRIEVTPIPEGFQVSGALDEPFVKQERPLPFGLQGLDEGMVGLTQKSAQPYTLLQNIARSSRESGRGRGHEDGRSAGPGGSLRCASAIDLCGSGRWREGMRGLVPFAAAEEGQRGREG